MACSFAAVEPEEHQGAARERQVETGGGGGHTGGMEERVARLETHFEYIRRDLDEIKEEQRETRVILSDIRTHLAKLPTTGNLWSMIASVVATALAIIGIVIAAIALVPAPARTISPAEKPPESAPSEIGRNMESRPVQE